MSTETNAVAEFRCRLPGIGMIENGDDLVAEIAQPLSETR